MPRTLGTSYDTVSAADVQSRKTSVCSRLHNEHKFCSTPTTTGTCIIDVHLSHAQHAKARHEQIIEERRPVHVFGASCGHASLLRCLHTRKTYICNITPCLARGISWNLLGIHQNTEHWSACNSSGLIKQVGSWGMLSSLFRLCFEMSSPGRRCFKSFKRVWVSNEETCQRSDLESNLHGCISTGILPPTSQWGTVAAWRVTSLNWIAYLVKIRAGRLLVADNLGFILKGPSHFLWFVFGKIWWLHKLIKLFCICRMTEYVAPFCHCIKFCCTSRVVPAVIEGANVCVKDLAAAKPLSASTRDLL